MITITIEIQTTKSWQVLNITFTHAQPEIFVTCSSIPCATTRLNSCLESEDKHAICLAQHGTCAKVSSLLDTPEALVGLGMTTTRFHTGGLIA